MSPGEQLQFIFGEALVRFPANISGVTTDFKASSADDSMAPLSSPNWAAQGDASDIPCWVREVVPSSVDEGFVTHNGVYVKEAVAEHAQLRTVVVRDARGLDDEALIQHCRDAYEAIFEGIDPASVARIWNYIPGINDLIVDGQDRYMLFNAGRYSAYQRVMPERESHPVASGVGHAGSDLVVHLLHGAGDVLGLRNPKQCLPHRYSSRYGQLPPAFSRAGLARFGSESWLLVSGTASVIGEDSCHKGNAAEQLAETICNLERVLNSAQGSVGSPVQFSSSTEWLVYTTDMSFADDIRAGLAASFQANHEKITVRRQPLCRSELMVEIECATKIVDFEVAWK